MIPYLIIDSDSLSMILVLPILIAGHHNKSRYWSKSSDDEITKRRAYFVVMFGCLLMGTLYFTSSRSPMAGPIHNFLSFMNDNIGGFYIDPNHYSEDGSFAGTRMVTDFGGSITIIGSDDGISWWKVNGEYIDESTGKMSIDFTVKGGPVIDAVYDEGVITWNDGNLWTKSEGEHLKVMSADSIIGADADEIGGFYIDPNHFDAAQGTFAGTRMISECEGDITLIGTDDGIDFWTVDGEEENGQVTVDFTVKGGPVVTGSYGNNVIMWEDGNQWTKSTLVSL